MKTCFTNARIVLSDEIIEDGALLIENGNIVAINPGRINGAETINLDGKLLMPGMIDLHCDALEKEVEPRPNVHFPLDFACAQADRRNAVSGVTTVYHALSFAHEELGVRNNDVAASIARSVNEWQFHALVDNRVHCRYEVTDEKALPILKKLIREGAAHLLSLMDHTPGQGQFKDIASYRGYLGGTYQKSADEVDIIVKRKLEAATGVFDRVEELALTAHAADIAVASHDDDSVARVDAMSKIGADISEFPVSMDAAKAAKAAGMFTVFGAPNILRGKSQSGSMKALEGINEGVADCLCADYVPASMIAAVFRIPELSDLDLPSAIRLVTGNPAKAARLYDRGEILAGKRADLIAVDFPEKLPQISAVWVNGVNTFQSFYETG